MEDIWPRGGQAKSSTVSDTKRDCAAQRMGMNINADIQEVINAADTSVWLRQALQSAVERDPADAANDAERLSELLARRFDTSVSESAEQMVRAWANSLPGEEDKLVDTENCRFSGSFKSVVQDIILASNEPQTNKPE